jgi:multidrug transporter EmrE-like cation transporter
MMDRARVAPQSLANPAQPAILVAVPLTVNLVFNILATAGFKLSAFSPKALGFLTWQVVGNLAGVLTIVTLTWLLCCLPLSVALPLTTGLAVPGVELAAGSVLLDETITTAQGIGTAAIVLGILLVGRA